MKFNSVNMYQVWLKPNNNNRLHKDVSELQRTSNVEAAKNSSKLKCPETNWGKLSRNKLRKIKYALYTQCIPVSLTLPDIIICKGTGRQQM